MDQALALLASLGMDHAFIATNGRDAPPRWRPPPAGAIGISGEFGGGGTLTPATLAATQRAIDQLLLALDVRRPGAGTARAGRRGMQLLALDSHAQAIFATRRGWFEPPWTLAPRSARAIWRATITT